MTVGDDTRARILATALELFSARGYRATSIREIAERLGLTKAALYYHFRSKDEIAVTLLGPVIDDVERILDEAAHKPNLTATRRHILEGILDVLLRRRQAFELFNHDYSVLADLPLGQRLCAIQRRANDLLSGPEAGWSERIRAAQAVAALTDPVALFPDLPVAELRDEILRGANQLLGLRTATTPSKRPVPSKRQARQVVGHAP